MADLTDILAGGFGGFANPSDPFGYGRIQAARQQLDQEQQRISLQRQMQPYSIADLMAGIKEKGAEADRLEAAAESTKKETARLEDTYAKGSDMRDAIAMIGARMKKAMAGGDASAAAPAQSAADALAAMQPGGGMPTFDERSPAALLGLPIPDTDTALTDFINNRLAGQAMARLGGAPITGHGKPDTSTLAGVAQVAAQSRAGFLAAAAAKQEADVASKRKPLADLASTILDNLSSPGFAPFQSALNSILPRLQAAGMQGVQDILDPKKVPASALSDIETLLGNYSLQFGPAATANPFAGQSAPWEQLTPEERAKLGPAWHL